MSPHLLNIPREIQDQILEYCLLVDGEINAYPMPFELEDGYIQKHPCVALVSVNKALRALAAPILYGKNTWKILGNFKWHRYKRLLDHDLGILTHLRHVTSSLDYRAYDAKSMLRVTWNTFDTNHTNLTPNQRESIHSQRLLLGLERWYDDMFEIMTSNLKVLTIDFVNAYCPSGCCRVFPNIISWMDWDFENWKFQITAVGLSSYEERLMHRVPGFHCKDCVGPKDERDRLYCSRYSQFSIED